MIPTGPCKASDVHSLNLRKYVSLFSSISPEGLPRKTPRVFLDLSKPQVSTKASVSISVLPDIHEFLIS